MTTQKNDDSTHEGSQYATPSNLSSRMALHHRFSVNKSGWSPWLIGQLALADGIHVLEIGCGTGWIWKSCLDLVPRDVELIMADRSIGMVGAAKMTLADAQLHATFQVMNADSLPLADNSLDVILAAHMLYHVSDRDIAIAEFRRVLKPGGQLVAATNGTMHMNQLDELARRFIPAFDPSAHVGGFTLENGLPQLQAHFDHVELRLYDDHLMVSDPEAVIAYIESLPDAQRATPEQLEALRDHARNSISEEHPMRIDKASGAFIAC